ncbi:riboflavin synthase [Brevibacillus ruminantium]|uniref:Riboflavin synthase n=1 Tax=Brevibacillus ruminantium TaxID=2950604 RepID=A0ABY4WI18_9BACL|nr:riboflavin synthase [Brevibacillus ruminantium]USG66793.1 riboflavin synthase [Brevibacillus ruminantium]
MFTGLIEEVGVVETVSSNDRSCKLIIRASKVVEDVRLGDSIAVNGVCLTVTSFSRARFQADVMPETWQVTNLSALQPGNRVNLERAMKLGERLGGHLVSGHVDGVGTILSRKADGNAVRYVIQTEPHLLRYVVPRGSITVDGISLTVVEAGVDRLSVSVIPHTLAQTNLQGKQAGDEVNLETDLLAKYVERLLGGNADCQPGKAAGLDLAFLQEHGFA